MADVFNFACELNSNYRNFLIAADGGASYKTGGAMHGRRAAEEQHGNCQAIATLRHHSPVPVGVADAMEAALLVTGAGAVTILTHCLIAIIRALVFVGAVIASVTASTVRLERGILPNDDFTVVLMAVNTGQVGAMVQRLKRCCGMTKIVWHEGVGVVTEIALQRGYEVISILAIRRGAVVAGRTGAKHLRVIDIQHRLPHGWGMAVFTNVRCKYVLRVLAGCNRTVMTADAIAGYVGVIVICGQPRNGGVAVVAVIAAGDMGRVFAGRGDTVVTRAATTEDLSVVDRDWRHPHCRAVAVLTNIGR